MKNIIISDMLTKEALVGVRLMSELDPAFYGYMSLVREANGTPEEIPFNIFFGYKSENLVGGDICKATVLIDESDDAYVFSVSPDETIVQVLERVRDEILASIPTSNEAIESLCAEFLKA